MCKLIQGRPLLIVGISDIIADGDLFMDFTEVSCTDPFMAVFIAAQKESYTQ